MGRTADNDIPLDVPEASRQHAKVELTENGFVVTDLGSGNGTFVNDERVTESPIANGDKVRFGSQTFVVKAE